MAHEYKSVTSPTTDYTAVSNVRDWEREDTLTWDRINEDYDTWNELTLIMEKYTGVIGI